MSGGAITQGALSGRRLAWGLTVRGGIVLGAVSWEVIVWGGIVLEPKIIIATLLR